MNGSTAQHNDLNAGGRIVPEGGAKFASSLLRIYHLPSTNHLHE
jgi:hypothetical protein